MEFESNCVGAIYSFDCVLNDKTCEKENYLSQRV